MPTINITFTLDESRLEDLIKSFLHITKSKEVNGSIELDRANNAKQLIGVGVGLRAPQGKLQMFAVELLSYTGIDEPHMKYMDTSKDAKI